MDLGGFWRLNDPRGTVQSRSNCFDADQCSAENFPPIPLRTSCQFNLSEALEAPQVSLTVYFVYFINTSGNRPRCESNSANTGLIFQRICKPSIPRTCFNCYLVGRPLFPGGISVRQGSDLVLGGLGISWVGNWHKRAFLGSSLQS